MYNTLYNHYSYAQLSVFKGLRSKMDLKNGNAQKKPRSKRVGTGLCIMLRLSKRYAYKYIRACETCEIIQLRR